MSDDVRDSVENEDSANGTGFNYSIEKYMDPNRPFKCEVCKESFTQKNILLVHYNSVSHLHRLKKSKAAAGEGKAKENNGSPAQATPEKTPSKGSALEALLGNLKGDRKDDDEVKPFKCNICKVAFTQGSTLDIHIRSVLHQTKASKLQELILTGQIDLSKPLIEQPDPQQLQDQHKKMINDMLSPKSCNSTGSTNSQSSPNIRSSSPDPQSSPLANLHALMGGGAKNSSSPPDGGTNSEGENMMSNLAKTFPFIPGLKQGGEREASEAGAAGGPDDKQPGSPVLKNLLQNYGMDLLKQFSDQKKQKQEQEDEEAAERNRSSTPHSDKGSSRPSSTAGPHSNMSEVQEALQKAMLQAQLQQMNPMLMQMSQMQGMNPLLAMNLHPPLIPPALLKGGQNPDLSAALKAQMQSTQQMMSGQGQPPPFMDPKLLAFMAANQQRQQDGGSGPDLKAMASMLGLPPPPQASPVTSEASPKPNLSSLQPAPPSSMESGKMNFTPPQMPDPKALLMSQQPIPNMPTPPDQGKRARTRITDEQLKILRSNFDINNSPAEDVLNMMAGQTGLPLKVIKHWFRNTLFKERQKNKDSPYNFNNPPSTKLNLEEYEKTGESKVTPLAPEEQGEYIRAEIEKMKKENEQKAEISLKSEQQPPVKIESPDLAAMNNNSEDSSNATTTNKVPKLNESSSENSLTLSRLLSSQLSQLPPLNPTSNLLPNFPAFPNVSSASGGISPLPPTAAGGKMPEYLNSLANRLSADQQQREQQRPLSPQSVSSGKRANRTRFTDYQIKVLQEFFENNAYPKDDDLEYLSKLLGLSPRVIVVWFQNARQKARKIYENQPAVDSPSPSAGSGSADEETGRFTRTAGCNYQCKKCLLVFQRYYELIRHQKQHCYKEEDAKRSALAQKAAAQAAAQYGPGSSGGPPQLMPLSEDSNSSIGGNEQARSITSPSISEKQQELSEMTKDAVNRMFGANQFLNYPPNSPFGILQQQALQQQQQMKMNQASSSQKGDNDDLGDDSDSLVSSPSSKRKLSEDGDDAAYNDSEEALAHKDKRLRTTILPEQLDFLYQKYQEDSNPSRKMLEQLAGEVGLRKRVVQVWFQNTRARERKGLYKPDENRQEAINKRCPFCPTVFKVRSALEAHLTLKHPEQPPGIIDIDALPNMAEDCSSSSELLDQQRPALPESPFPVSEHIASLMPNAAAAAAGNAMNLQDSMRKYYEDTMKRFMNDISKSSSSNGEAASSSNFLQQQQSSASLPLLPLPPADSSSNSQQIALDLTSNYDDSSDHLEDLDPNRSIETDSVNGVGGGGNKRFRTQMSGVQVKMMKAIFEVYKTPTMTECSGLGQDIGLQKRVVQVWFQNARAKEKRAKLQLQQATGSEPDGPPPPEECKTCNLKYSHKFAVQDHLFTKDHLDKLRVAIEQGRYDPESPGHAMSQTAAILQGNGQQQPGQRTNSTDSSPLQMLQMTTQVNNRELIEMSSHQNPRMLMQV